MIGMGRTKTILEKYCQSKMLVEECIKKKAEEGEQS